MEFDSKLQLLWEDYLQEREINDWNKIQHFKEEINKKSQEDAFLWISMHYLTIQTELDKFYWKKLIFESYLKNESVKNHWYFFVVSHIKSSKLLITYIGFFDNYSTEIMKYLINNYSHHLIDPAWSNFLNHPLITSPMIGDIISKSILHYTLTADHLNISQLFFNPNSSLLQLKSICDYLRNTAKCISLASIMARPEASYDWILYEFKNPNQSMKIIGINYNDLANHFKKWTNVQKIDFLTQLPHMNNILLEIDPLDASIEILE